MILCRKAGEASKGILRNKNVMANIKLIIRQIIEKLFKTALFFLNSRNRISRTGKLMRDNAAIIYLVRESNIIYCWWSFTRFVSLFASKLRYPRCALEKRNEKRKIVATMATAVVFRGSMTVTQPGRLRRKMKRYE